MTNLVLLAQSENWLANWITPLWLLGLGMLAGLALLVVVWLAGCVICRIPGLGKLLEKPHVRPRVALIATLLSLIGLAIGTVVSLQGQDLTDALGHTLPIALGGWLVLLALLALTSRRAVSEVPLMIKEGPLVIVLVVAGLLSLFGIFGTAAVNRPRDFVRSLQRLPDVGTQTIRGISIAADSSADAEQEIAVSFRRDEIEQLTFMSDQPLRITTAPAAEMPSGATFDVARDDAFRWVRAEQPFNPFIEDRVSSLYVQNMGDGAASLDVTIQTVPQYPQVRLILSAALALIAVVLLYFVQRTFAPRLTAVSLATIKSQLGQPVFPILLAAGFFLLTLAVFLPYNTFGEDIKMLKDAGLITIMALAIFLAVWTANVTVSDEIEGRTALTVLSKPINRRAFLSGKFVGITWTTALLFIVLGAYFLILVAYKPVYDGKESSQSGTTWELCHLEMVRTVPGLVLGFLETVVMASLSVAIATRLTMLANFAICFAIYVLGHMTPLIVQSSVGRFEVVAFVGQLIAVVFPNLENFNIQAAVATGTAVPVVYLTWALIYCAVYSAVAMLLALLLFEDRDLA